MLTPFATSVLLASAEAVDISFKPAYISKHDHYHLDYTPNPYRLSSSDYYSGVSYVHSRTDHTPYDYTESSVLKSFTDGYSSSHSNSALDDLNRIVFGDSDYDIGDYVSDLAEKQSRERHYYEAYNHDSSHYDGGYDSGYAYEQQHYSDGYHDYDHGHQ